MAAAMGAADDFGHGRQRRIDCALELHSAAEDSDLQGLALVETGEDGAGRRKAGMRRALGRKRERMRSQSRGWPLGPEMTL